MRICSRQRPFGAILNGPIGIVLHGVLAAFSGCSSSKRALDLCRSIERESDYAVVTPTGDNELMNFGFEITHRLFFTLLDRSYPRTQKPPSCITTFSYLLFLLNELGRCLLAAFVDSKLAQRVIKTSPPIPPLLNHYEIKIRDVLLMPSEVTGSHARRYRRNG